MPQWTTDNFRDLCNLSLTNPLQPHKFCAKFIGCLSIEFVSTVDQIGYAINLVICKLFSIKIRLNKKKFKFNGTNSFKCLFKQSFSWGASFTGINWSWLHTCNLASEPTAATTAYRRRRCRHDSSFVLRAVADAGVGDAVWRSRSWEQVICCCNCCMWLRMDYDRCVNAIWSAFNPLGRFALLHCSEHGDVSPIDGDVH